jgi:hypothetical protein
MIKQYEGNTVLLPLARHKRRIDDQAVALKKGFFNALSRRD